MRFQTLFQKATTIMSKPNIEIIPNDLTTKTKLHLLPVDIEYTGPARVSDFLVLQNEKGEIIQYDDVTTVSTTECSFRGRLLKGQRVELPEDCKGYVIRQEEQEMDSKQIWKPIQKFQDFVYWNRELKPNSTDKPKVWLDWTKLSESIHKPIDEKTVKQSNETYNKIFAKRAKEMKAETKNNKQNDEDRANDTTADTSPQKTSKSPKKLSKSPKKLSKSPKTTAKSPKTTQSPRKSPRKSPGRTTPTKTRATPSKTDEKIEKLSKVSKTSSPRRTPTRVAATKQFDTPNTSPRKRTVDASSPRKSPRKSPRRLLTSPLKRKVVENDESASSNEEKKVTKKRRLKKKSSTDSDD